MSSTKRGSFSGLLPVLLAFLVGCQVGRSLNGLTFSSFSTSVPKEEAPLAPAKRWTAPLERSAKPVEFLPGRTTDVYTPFHDYLNKFGQATFQPPSDFGLPLLHIWPHFFEAYHNHFHRYIGKEVVFMEVGVQSGGKIALLREYFGSGFTYIGVDINPACKMFESADWIHIEIGNSGDPVFLQELKQKHPKVDIFLDDGGHTMTQQRHALQYLLPHVQPDGIYACEDLSTSFSTQFGGRQHSDIRDEFFRESTMMGMIHRTIDWLNYDWVEGGITKPNSFADVNSFWSESWWKDVALSVKHIHVYNMIVVYEKGQMPAHFHTMTVGPSIPYKDKRVIHRDRVNWDPILQEVESRLQWNLTVW